MKKFNWFIKDNKDSEVDDTTNQEQSFFKRMKNDSKYKAKVELTGYAIFIIVLIIFLILVAIMIIVMVIIQIIK